MTHLAPPAVDSPSQRTDRRRPAVSAVAAALLVAAATVGTGTANADSVAYLVNVTVRPGYGFPNADAALAYGHSLCDKIQAGTQYPSLMSDIRRDFHTNDDYQASYLITQAANELCPAAIWQLRKSAAAYRPGSE